MLHFHLNPADLPSPDEIGLLFQSYRRWGVRAAALFDQPNSHKNWQATAWAQTDLVERFLDLYLPLADASLRAGLTPIFPPLKPGGDYWDTAFLRAALQSLQRRSQHNLLNQLIIGAYAQAGERTLQWGAGGPERWPNAVPISLLQAQKISVAFVFLIGTLPSAGRCFLRSVQSFYLGWDAPPMQTKMAKKI